MTRDSVLTLAREEGYRVEERLFDVAEMLEWVRDGEAALSGTAAVLAGVGTLVHHGQEHRVGSGEVGPHTRKLRERLVSIQRGEVTGHARLDSTGVTAAGSSGQHSLLRPGGGTGRARL